jgi:hypothetical protein
MKRLCVLLVAASLVMIGCGRPGTGDLPAGGAEAEWTRPDVQTGSDCLPLGPQSVVLSGTFDTILRFGPPNFGEQPEKDERLVVPVVRAREPFVVCLVPDQLDSLPPLSVIQIGFQAASMIPTELYGQEISATGTLIPAVSGYHFTPVVLQVTRILPR